MAKNLTKTQDVSAGSLDRKHHRKLLAHFADFHSLHHDELAANISRVHRHPAMAGKLGNTGIPDSSKAPVGDRFRADELEMPAAANFVRHLNFLP